jgi:hypothetical protein
VNWWRSLPAALRIAIYAAACGVVGLALGIGIGAIAATLYEGSIGSSKGAESQGDSNQEQAQSDASAAKYTADVADIQNRAVEAFVGTHEKLIRYDNLSADDVEDLQANRIALEEDSNLAENLSPPEEYLGQYNLFRAAIDDLSNAAEIAYRVVANPVSATPDAFQEYDVLVTEATANLESSNEALGQDYRTTEGLPKVGPAAL